MAVNFIKKRGAQRLRVLAEYLKLVKDDQFNMNFWRAKRVGTVLSTDHRAEVGKCGTVSCAFGHAISLFPELSFVNERHGDVILEDTDSHGWAVFKQSADPVGIAAAFFGLTPKQAMSLFIPDDVESVSKNEVIKRIKKMANRLKAA